MAVSDDEFDTSLAATTGCAAGNAPLIGGGGTLLRANSASSIFNRRVPVSAGSSETDWLFSNPSPDGFPAASGPACRASCSKLSAAALAVARAASTGVDAVGLTGFAAPKPGASCGTGGAAAWSVAPKVEISGASSGTSAGDAIVGVSGPTAMMTGCIEP